MNERSRRSVSPFQASSLERALGAALFIDTASLVWVLDCEGTVHACNALAREFCECDGQSPPTHLRDAIKGHICLELLQHIRQAVECGEARCLRAIICGAAFLSTLRPFASEDGDPLALFVCTPMHELAALNGSLHDFPTVELQAKDLGPLERLTSREMEVLQLIGEGLTIQQIAHKLHRGVKTIETHRTTLGRKLGARNRIELARIAIVAGLAQPARRD